MVVYVVIVHDVSEETSEPFWVEGIYKSYSNALEKMCEMCDQYGSSFVKEYRVK